MLVTVADNEDVLRLQRELAEARVDELQARLAELQGQQTDGPPASSTNPRASAPPYTGLVEQAETYPPLPFQEGPAGGSPRIQVLTGSQVDPATRQLLQQVLGRWVPNLGINAAGAPTAPADLNLSAAPRHVPLGYRLIVLPWSAWTVFALVMVASAPVALWIVAPVAGVIAAVVTLLVVVLARLRRYVITMRLLRWGEVATVERADVLSQGTYYSGSTYRNIRLPIAHGWHVDRQFYSGPGTKTKLHYRLGQAEGDLVLRGREYIDGVVLADSRKPSRAACVTAIPYDLDRDAGGNWIGRLRTGTVVGAIAMLIVLIGWTAGMIWLWGVEAGGLDTWLT